MEREQVVFVQCDFLRGGFPSERVFLLQLPDGAKMSGTAPAHYCYTADRKPLGNAPAEGERVNGLVAGLEIARPDADTVRVYLPDGQVYDLDAGQILPVPRGGVEHVPVGT